jgi:hypothetical protein
MQGRLSEAPKDLDNRQISGWAVNRRCRAMIDIVGYRPLRNEGIGGILLGGKQFEVGDESRKVRRDQAGKRDTSLHEIGSGPLLGPFGQAG